MDLIFIGPKWPVLIGLSVGGTLGIVKLMLMSRMFTEILSGTQDRSSGRRYVLLYIGCFFLLIAIMAVSAAASIWLFGGVAAGVLGVPFVMFVYSLAGSAKITGGDSGD